MRLATLDHRLSCADLTVPVLMFVDGDDQAVDPRPAREYARLSSFPDGFQFADSWAAFRLVGNSVPPLFMRAIARHVYSGCILTLQELQGRDGNHDENQEQEKQCA